jgi:hypothetical protein
MLEELELQGMSREEAVLFLFEKNYGKVSTQSKNSTPNLVYIYIFLLNMCCSLFVLSLKILRNILNKILNNKF